MGYWWLDNRHKKVRECDPAKMWELLRHTPIYREAWDYQKRHGPVPFDRNPPEITTRKISVGGSQKTARKVIDFNSRKIDWGRPIWCLIGAARPSEDFDPDKSWLDLSEEQQDIIRQELLHLDPLGQIHDPAKSGRPYFRTDCVLLKRRGDGQEEILWSSSHAVVQSKEDSTFFPVFREEGSGKKLFFFVLLFDERQRPKAVTDQLKVFRQRGLRKLLDQLYMKHWEDVVASRSTDKLENPLEVFLPKYFRKESNVPWSKVRRLIRNQIRKTQKDFEKSGCHGSGQKTKRARNPLSRYIQLIRSVQPPLCQLWFPIGLTERQLVEGFEKRFRSYRNEKGSQSLSDGDIKSPQRFVAKLKKLPTDALSTYLNGRLTQLPRQQSAALDDSNSDYAAMEVSLIKSLNSIIHGPSIYDTQRFEGVILRSETLETLDRNPQEEDLVRLNRLLLEDAYPTEILRTHKPLLRFKRTTRQIADKTAKLGFPWLGLTGHLIKEKEGKIGNKSSLVLKLINKNMAADLEAINSARQNVEGLMREIHTRWQQQLLLP